MASSSVPLGYWSNTFTSTQTQLTSIDPTRASELSSYIVSITKALATQTNHASQVILDHSLRGALARLTIISAEDVLATATEGLTASTPTAVAQAISQASDAIIEATLNLQSLYDDDNLYKSMLSLGGNAFFAASFGLLLVTHTGILAWSRNWYVCICLMCGTGLEFAGYVARVISAGDETLLDPFIAQICCLTIAPAFIMAAIYMSLAELIVVQGTKTSVMRPLWFSYIFIVCDFISLVVQAIGGAMASIASQQYKSADLGSNVMLAGIVFQVVTMSAFVYFLFDYYFRSMYHFESLAKVGVKSFLQILFGTPQGVKYQKELYHSYDPRFSPQRDHSPILFRYLPLGILASVTFVYIRCVYRVVELAQGWHGYLITTEAFLLILDGTMIFLTSTLFVLFHPAIVFGKDNNLNVAIRDVSNELKQSRKERKTGKEEGFADSTGTSDGDLTLLVRPLGEKIEPKEFA